MSGRVRRQGTPFPFEGPVPPELLIDREDELALVGRHAGDRVNVRLVAPRRYGKTSLLLAHAAQLQQVGWRTVHVDLYGIADYTDVARRVARAYGHLDAPWMRSHLSGLLGRLGVTMSATGPTVTLAARPSATPDAAAAETVLERLLDLPVTLFEHDGSSTLVVFDEFQELLVARRDLDGLLRSRIQYHGDAAAYVFAGSEPSMMRELYRSRRSLTSLPGSSKRGSTAARRSATSSSSLAGIRSGRCCSPTCSPTASPPGSRPPRRSPTR